ncbi:condensin subunit Smc [Thiohalospira halophila DSM 15071]|uniref:Chromosome partition protein Smc n=1 Tax=Thiohalospira halophila DSM 15071 TaxID=1123397 RepID=A0A1I1ND40_9GAMM|nr:chromosome segregation protein SMC [Thiohalospira halophila]SFC93368.1 condensin subunit Smc [Thiohalospira halophila DSM 15071]
MRLSRIKLAGFKSFVDPTTIPLPGNRVGVVGPNGCGKSNVIDAVRWVMGESSARHLRGEAMSDVIFNGSSSRKPVGQASIEMVFDNSEGGLTGQYAHYNELAVRRTVTREGQSTYYLNGTRCRRRDITDIFLGTGLGPRSYAIIQQNTVSRLIEARPDEMRTYLEEAAGISKYKERRRETENRIRHTRENLERLEDLREELDRHLEHLEKQARTAERYKELRAEEHTLRGQLQALRWRILDAECAAHDRAVSEKETALEAEIAGQRRIEAEMEERRSEQAEASDAFSEVQERYYAVGADIARLEEAIEQARARRQQREEEREQLDTALAETDQRLETDRARLAELDGALAEGEPELERLEAADTEAGEALAAAEEARRQWQQEWERLNQALADPTREAEVARNNLTNLERRADDAVRRRERLERERAELDPDAATRAAEEAETALATADADRQHREAALAERQQTLETQRQATRTAAERRDAARDELQQARGRHASLEALQQAALGKDDDSRSQWLERQGLADAHRLAELIEAEPEWAPAVEAVLGEALEAVRTDRLDDPAAALADLAGADLTLLEARAGGSPAADSLAARVRAPVDLAPLLAGVFTAPDRTTALARRTELGPGESWVTPDGIQVGTNWLRVRRGDDQGEGAGVLAREEEMRTLAERIAELESAAAEAEAEVETGRSREAELETEREADQQAVAELQQRCTELAGERDRQRARSEELAGRREELSEQIAELEEESEAVAEEQETERERLAEALERSESLAAERDDHATHRQERDEAVEAARQAQREATRAVQDHRLALERQRTERASLQQALERLEQQHAQYVERRDALAGELAAEEDPVATRQAELEERLNERREVEAALAAARERSEAVEAALRELDGQRAEARTNAERLREEAERARGDARELRVRRETLREQMDEAGHDREALLAELPEEASEEAWQKRLEEVEAAIKRLGAINLAAIDEYQQQSERKEHLDQQREDLLGALETLEEAIDRIDRETRNRFRETFDAVNAGLGELFPRLFNGGHSYLQLVGDDPLDAGIGVMARPPGKQNSSIHLLSGGEKALTAVALVFAFFQLNPSPFCLLDEVDAPLDDANVGRFCELVREMSEKTQFIIITHNKVTMEMADQLNGITMNEPGVSRLVTVDVDEAASLARTA